MDIRSVVMNEPQLVGADAVLSEADSWAEAVRCFRTAAETLISHPYATFALPSWDVPEAEVEVGVKGVELTFNEHVLELMASTHQYQVAEAIARANQGYVVLRFCGEVLVWKKLSVQTAEKAGSELGKRLVRENRWRRAGRGVIYWPGWQTGVSSPGSGDLEADSTDEASAEPVDRVMPEGSDGNGEQSKDGKNCGVMAPVEGAGTSEKAVVPSMGVEENATGAESGE